MADQLYLSYWLNGFSGANMLKHYEKLLKLFPYSRLTKSEGAFRITPVNYGEPTIFERPAGNPIDPTTTIAAAKEFDNPDCCYQLETAWDIWQYEQDWELQTSRVSLVCFGPEFENEVTDNLRIEFGIDTHFLPQPDLPGHATMTQSNIRSLLKLVHDLDDRLAAERRQLWTESGENFAEKLQKASQT
jgi:hypothetical protein